VLKVRKYYLKLVECGLVDQPAVLPADRYRLSVAASRGGHPYVRRLELAALVLRPPPISLNHPLPIVAPATRASAGDATIQAVTMTSKEASRPITEIWTRQQDLR
jgi:hypothetical protein